MHLRQKNHKRKQGEWSRKNEDGKGIKHFVFDFPTHAANGTFKGIQQIA